MVLSSYEAEYIATSLCAYQVIWLMNLIQKLINERCDTVTLRTANIFVINLAKNFIAHGRSRHINMKFHYLKERVSERKLKFKHCKNENQVTNLLTKDITIEFYKILKKLMSLEALSNLN